MMKLTLTITGLLLAVSLMTVGCDKAEKEDDDKEKVTQITVDDAKNANESATEKQEDDDKENGKEDDDKDEKEDDD